MSFSHKKAQKRKKDFLLLLVIFFVLFVIFLNAFRPQRHTKLKIS